MPSAVRALLFTATWGAKNMNILQKILAKLKLWFARPAKPSEPEPKPSAPETQPEIKLPRRDRRRLIALERARRKHDVFVTPKGPEPLKRERKQPPINKNPKPEPEPELSDGDTEYHIADKLHYDELVLVKESEMYGEFNFRDTILDQLDRYWTYLERMKKHDADAYGFYKELGSILVPHAASRTYKNELTHKWTAEEIEQCKKFNVLPPWFRKNRPSFGCVAYGTHSIAEQIESENRKNTKALWIPKFIYFVKYKLPPPEVQPMKGGDVYSLTIWWDQPQRMKNAKKWGVPTAFPVFVSEDGKDIRILKKISTRMVPIKRKRGYKFFKVPERAWHIDSEYETWAKDHGVDVQTYLKAIFCDAIKEQEWTSYSMVRVAVKNGDLTAVFGVNIQRMAYFFQDRDIELTVDGMRKRIFHLVKPHVRKDGSIVKMHFRGAKKFNWAGYEVSITVPGLDHTPLQEFNIGASDEYWFDKNKEKLMPQAKLGKLLAEKIIRGGL